MEVTFRHLTYKKSDFLHFFLLFSLFFTFNIESPLDASLKCPHSTEWRVPVKQNSVVVQSQETSDLLTALSRAKALDTVIALVLILLTACFVLSRRLFCYFLAKYFPKLEILSSRNHPPTLFI